MEVDTPVLTAAGCSDPNLANISCRLQIHPDRDFFLQTSPEYAMKRLLAAGSPDIYQICKVFRDAELGANHQPEFTMLEWYRKDFSLNEMFGETCSLFRFLCQADELETNTALLDEPSVFRYEEIFRSATGLDPLRSDMAELRKCASKTACMSTTLEQRLGTNRSAWLDFLMGQTIIPSLAGQGLVIIHDYPADQAMLARLRPDDPRLAERFEIFFDGLELANGYRELCDSAEQRRRFEHDRGRRSHHGLPEIAADTALLSALEYGLPDCCGVAVGFDRLLMSLFGLSDIRRSMSFAIHDNP